MDRKQRVLAVTEGNGITDISASVNSMDGSIEIELSATKPLYIASEFPFNHKYFVAEVQNPKPGMGHGHAHGAGEDPHEADLLVRIWTGKEWEDAEDVINTTDALGVPFRVNGSVSFRPKVNGRGWGLQSLSRDIEELEDGPQIHSMFWCEISATDDVEVVIQYIGQKFMEQSDLFDIYPDLNRANLMTAFRAGKTSWDEQIVIASAEIANDLRQRRVIVRRDQIMDTSLLKAACRHKAAEIIYTGLGNGHLDSRILAEKAYSKAMAKDFFEVDRDGSGYVSSNEKTFNCTFGSR